MHISTIKSDRLLYTLSTTSHTSVEIQTKMNSTESPSHPFEQVKQEFLNTWPKVKDIISLTKDEFDEESIKWLVDTLEYNVMNGKMLRGLLSITAFMNFSKKSAGDKGMEGAYMLGWVYEILQGACLVADDIMDNSETRRGKPCWYKVPNVGLLAVNDAFMLNYAAYKVLDHAFLKTEYYKPLMAMFCDICFKTTVGQNLDAQTGDIQLYTMERYERLVQYKTSYYTFVAPVLGGQILAGKGAQCSAEDLSLLKEALLELGLLFQAQDDMLDVFGDPEVTGKVGTDVQDKKCTWLLATYLENAGLADVENMINYFDDPTANHTKIKQKYKEHEIEEKFEKFLEEKSALITKICYGLENKEMEKLVLALLALLNMRKF